MELDITTLSENTAGVTNLLAEWGLSILVETDNVNILFDTGQSISTCHNADALGVDLAKIDKIVLSHGHQDHTGGLREVLQRVRSQKNEIEIIAHPDIWTAKYSRRQGRADRYNGIPFQQHELESLGARFNLTTEPVKITDEIMTTGEVPMVTDFEEISSNLFIKENTDFKPDEILDDQAIIINTEQGLVVITGCAHRGIINTLYHAQEITGVEVIHAVIGGGHLIGASELRVWQTIDALRELDIQKLGLCHCTSLPAMTLLAREIGDKFFFNNTGTRIGLP